MSYRKGITFVQCLIDFLHQGLRGNSFQLVGRTKASPVVGFGRRSLVVGCANLVEKGLSGKCQPEIFKTPIFNSKGLR